VRCRPALTRLLVVLLLLQWGTAFGHCLRLAAPAEGFAVEICTPDGIHRVVLQAEDGEDGPRHAMPGSVCPACQGPASIALPPPPVALVAPLLLVQAADPPLPRPGVPQPAPTPYCQPRAPPTS
jgi:hypothetical protein